MHVLNMRSKADTQSEIRGLTAQFGQEIEDWAPITTEIFDRRTPTPLMP